jgi:homospermidine synthase
MKNKKDRLNNLKLKIQSFNEINKCLYQILRKIRIERESKKEKFTLIDVIEMIKKISLKNIQKIGFVKNEITNINKKQLLYKMIYGAKKPQLINIKNFKHLEIKQ